MGFGNRDGDSSFGDDGNSTTTTGTNGGGDDDDFGITKECFVESKYEIKFKVEPPVTSGSGTRQSALDDDAKWKMYLEIKQTHSCKCKYAISSETDKAEFNTNCDINSNNVQPDCDKDGSRRVTFHKTKHCGNCDKDPNDADDGGWTSVGEYECKCKNLVVTCTYECEDLASTLDHIVGATDPGWGPPTNPSVAIRLAKECGCDYTDLSKEQPQYSTDADRVVVVEIPPGSPCSECMLKKLLCDSHDTEAIALLIEALDINTAICNSTYLWGRPCFVVCQNAECPPPEVAKMLCPDIPGFTKLD